MRWQANNWETKTSRQTKAMLPNQDKKEQLVLSPWQAKLSLFLLGWGLVHHTHTHTHLCSHICQISQCSNRPPGTDLPAKHTIMPFLISAREDLKRKGKKTHFPNKEGEKWRTNEYSEWAMKTGMGRGIKERDAQQIRAAEIWSCTFYVYHSFVPFGSRWTHSRLVKSEKIT